MGVNNQMSYNYGYPDSFYNRQNKLLKKQDNLEAKTKDVKETEQANSAYMERNRETGEFTKKLFATIKERQEFLKKQQGFVNADYINAERIADYFVTDGQADKYRKLWKG